MIQTGGWLRSLGWWAVAYAVFVTPIDFSTLGLASDNGIDGLKWFARFPVWYLPLVLIGGRWAQLLQAIRLPPISWLLLWTGVAAASVAWSIVPDQSILGGLAMTSLALLATWFVYTAGWDAFASAVATGGTALIAAGLIDNARDGTLLSERSLGLMSAPANLAQVAALTIVFATMLMWRRPSRLLPLASITLCLLAMVSAQTRTPVVGLLVALLYGASQRLPREHRMILTSIIIVGGVALTLGLGADTLSRQDDQSDLSTFTGRTEIWPVAIDLVTEKPVLGYGASSSETLFEAAANDGRLGFDASTSHSLPLEAAITGGILGASLLAVAFASALLRRRRVDAWVVAPVLFILINGAVEAMINVPTLNVVILAGSFAAIAFTRPTPAGVGGAVQSAHAAAAARPPQLPRHV